MTNDSKFDLPQGTLDLRILRVVALGPVHGYAIAQRIQMISREALQVQQGSLYPALHALEADGALEANWQESDRGPRRRYYKITQSGLGMLAEHAQEWAAFSLGMGHAVGEPNR